MSKTYMEKLIDTYRQQTVQSFNTANPNAFSKGFGISVLKEKGLRTKDGLGEPLPHTNQVELLYNTGGLFADCCLESPILNTLISPIYSMANIIPVRPTIQERTRFGYLTQISDPGTNYPDEPCDESPTIGDLTGACFADFAPGRLSYQTRTMELDALIKNACRGITDNLYFVGDARGVSAIPQQEWLTNRNLVKRAAVRRSMWNLGRTMQRDIMRQFWLGDPTNLATNTPGGGRREFWGLDFMIADDYGTPAKPWVTGTLCSNLNSDIKDFALNCVGGAVSLYNYMQELEDTLFQRASYQGLLPVEWVWVMHPIAWAELIKTLPCEILSYSCANPNISVNVSGDNGLGMVALQQEMRNTMSVTVNGRTYSVVLDQALPIVTVPPVPPATAPSYISAIYFVPLRVAGEEVLFWQHMDYTQFEDQIAPIPGSADVGLRGWTDGGRFHFIVERSRRCFAIDGKTELALVFKAPWLAGKIENIRLCPLQAKPVVTWP